MLNFRFVNVVWGKAYTETFLNVCLPASLTAGNLPYLATRSRSVYRLYTSYEDCETILKAPAFRRLSSLMDTGIVRVDGKFIADDGATNSVGGEKYDAMSQCHSHFIQSAPREDHAMVCLSPDFFWADGSFRRLFEIAKSGKRLVMVGGLRTAKEGFITALRKTHLCGSALRPVCGRELVKLALDNLHPETKSLIWNSEQSNSWPSLLLWRLKEGLLLRAFHLHPLLIRPVRPGIIPNGTIDGAYVDEACPDPADEYIVNDSDEMVGFELSRSQSRSEFIKPTRPNTRAVAAWARQHASSKHRNFVRQKIRYHCGDLSPNCWEATEAASDQAIQEIQSHLELCESRPTFPLGAAPAFQP